MTTQELTEALAKAEHDKILIDAQYRQWRARFGADVLDANPKLSEWKVKQAIEKQEQFTEFKLSIARAQYQVVRLRGMYHTQRQIGIEVGVEL